MITKEDVRAAAKRLIESRLGNIRSSLNDLDSAIRNDTKSSAGDKHETSRAMAHLEQEKLSGQLSLLESQLNAIDTQLTNHSLIITDKGNFYVGVPLGKLNVNNTEIICISRTSPLGGLLYNVPVNSQVSLNSISYKVLERL